MKLPLETRERLAFRFYRALIFLAALFFLWICLLQILKPLTDPKWYEREVLGPLPGFAVLFFLGAVSVGLGLLAAHVHNAYANPLRAKLLLQRAREDDRPPILVLRSFSQWGLQRIHHHNYFKPSLSHSRYYLSDLANAVSLTGIGQVVAIGETDAWFATGAGMQSWKIEILFLPSKTEHWRRLVKSLGHASRMIFMFPGTTEGIIEELDFINSERLTSKVLVFMPPGTSSSDDPTRSQWESAKERLGARSLRLPDYRSEGMLFLIKEDFSVRRSLNLKGSRTSNATLADAVRHLCRWTCGETRPLCELVREFEELSTALLLSSET